MKIINSVSRVMGLVATGLLLPLLVLMVTHVFLRFAFNSPITGTAEITELIMACLTLGMAWAGVQRRHVKVDIIMSHLPARVQAIIGSITFLLGLVTMVIMTWRGLLTSVFTVYKEKYIASVLLPVPIFPFYWVFVLGSAVMCLVLVTLFIEQVKEVFKR